MVFLIFQAPNEAEKRKRERNKYSKRKRRKIERKTILPKKLTHAQAQVGKKANLKLKQTDAGSENIKFADEMAEATSGISYHSGKTAKQRVDILKCFTEGDCRVLCSTKALNQGFNIPDVGVGVIVGLDSKALPMIQRIGRLLRKSEDKIGKIYILYVKDSQEEKWLINATKNLSNVIWK